MSEKHNTLIARKPKCRCVTGISVLERQRPANLLATFVEWLAAGCDLETGERIAAVEEFKATYGCSHEDEARESVDPVRLMFDAMKQLKHLYNYELDYIVEEFSDRFAEYEEDLKEQEEIAEAEQRKDA